MRKHRIIYLFFAFMVFSVITIILLLNSTKMLQWAADKYGPEYHFGYKEISGTLLSGIQVKGLTFKGDKLLDGLKAHWNPVSIFYNRLTFTSIEANGLDVENTKTALETFRPLKSQNNNTCIIPISVAVEELKLSVKPFTQSGVGFTTISLDGEDMVYSDEAIEIVDLFLSVDTNVTKIELSGGIQDKHISVKDLSVLDIDTTALSGVMKKMVEMRLQEKVVETVEPGIQQYRAGKENYIPKSVSVDSIVFTLKSADHAEIRLNKGEMKVDDLNADIYKMLEYQPNTVQIGDLSVLLDTNLSRLALDSKLKGETISVNAFSLHDVDVMALNKIFTSIQKDLTEDPKTLDINHTIATMFPKYLHVRDMEASMKSLNHDPIFVKKADLNATDLMLDIGKLSLQSGVFNVSLISNFISLRQEGNIENNHVKSKGNVTLHKGLFESYKLPIKESTLDLNITDLKKNKNELIVAFNACGEEVFQEQKNQFSIEVLSLKNRVVYKIDEGVLSVENEGNLSMPHVKDTLVENSVILQDGVRNYSGKVIPGEFENIDTNFTKALEGLEITYQGDDDSIDIRINADGFNGRLTSDDLKKADLRITTKEEYPLKNMFLLPHALRPSKAMVDIHVPLDFTQIIPLHADARITSDLVDMDIDLVYDSEYNITTTTVIPEDSLLREFRDELNFDMISPIYTDLVLQGEMLHGNVRSKGMESKVKLNLDNKDLEGYTVLGGAKFGYLGNMDANISVNYHTSSVHGFLKQMSSIYAFEPPPLDGDAKISMEFSSLKDIKLNLNSNALVYKADSTEQHVFNNTMISLGLVDSALLLNQYYTTFGEQKLFSDKPSVITFEDGSISVDPLWLNNELKITGNYNFKRQEGEGSFIADAFKVSHEKSDLTNRIDIQTKTSEFKTDISGTITLLDGTIQKEIETKKFSPDSNIVDVKEVEKRKSMLYMTNLSSSIKLNTAKEISFKTDKADLKTDVDLVIQKEYSEPIAVLGSIKILDGSTYSISNKKFLVKNSTVNLLGDPFNPYLDITALYKTRQTEIMIQVTGDLQNPNITFSSTPYMSRKRILSTILFDVQDTSNISEENMLLMMGDSVSRSLLSNIGGETIKYAFSAIGINIDKLPFIGRSWDANQSAEAFLTFFSDEEPRYPSHEIHFTGQKYITKKQLQKAMGVDTKSFIAFWKDDAPTINDRLLPTLERSLQNFYASEGYYNAAFSIDRSKSEVMVRIEEKDPVKILDINIESDYPISEFITFKQGDIFRSKEFIALKKNITDKLMKDGYCSYDLDSKAYVDKDAHTVSIDLKLKKGEVCTFGKVTIKDFETIDESVIISRMRVKEGDPFTTKQIQETYDALYALNVFDSITVGHDRKIFNVVPVEIDGSVVQRPWYFSADVDYTSSDGFRLSTEVKRTNFLGNAKNISLDFTYSRIEKGLELSYFVPALFSVSDYYFDFISKVGLSEFDYEGFTEEKKYVEALLGYNDDKWSINAGLAMENIDILPHNELFSQSIEGGEFSPIYPFVHFNYDARDSKIFPKNGYYVGGSVEYGLPYAEENPYFKYSLEGRMIYTHSQVTYSAIVKTGIVDYSDESIPESKLFFAGGFDTNRAYGYKELGVITSPTSYAIEGAATMANLTFEACYPIGENLYAEVFTDNTMLTKEDYDFSGNIITSAGLGMGYRTPLGQIKLDVGMNVRDSSIFEVNLYIGQSF